MSLLLRFLGFGTSSPNTSQPHATPTTSSSSTSQPPQTPTTPSPSTSKPPQQPTPPSPSSSPQAVPRVLAHFRTQATAEPLRRRMVHENHKETIIVAHRRTFGSQTFIDFVDQRNETTQRAPKNVQGFMKQVGFMNLHLSHPTAQFSPTYQATYGELGYGFIITAAHTYEVDGMYNLTSGVLCETLGVAGFEGKVDEDALDSGFIGSPFSFIASPASSSIPFYFSVAVEEDVILLRSDDTSTHGTPLQHRLLPGVLLSDGVVRLITINGNAGYKESVKVYGKAVAVTFQEFAEKKKCLRPEEVSFVEGKGFLAGKANSEIHYQLSSLFGASGGVLLNSQNELIGIHHGGVGPSIGQAIGTFNRGVNFNTPLLKSFFLRNLVPLLPVGSVEQKAWSAFATSP